MNWPSFRPFLIDPIQHSNEGDSMTNTTCKLTIDEIKTAIASAMEVIKTLDVHPVATIENYPIGGRNRGRCELAVERHAKHGWRTCKTTTNKNGVWCAPKKSVYHKEGGCFVVTGGAVERDVEWLAVTSRGVYFQAANGESRWLLETPFSGYVRREAYHYTIGAEKKCFEADSPEVIAAWDAYVEGIDANLEWLKQSLDKTVECSA